MGLFQSDIYIMSIISHRQYNFESFKAVLLQKTICWYIVQSHPEDHGDFGQGSTVNISECNNQLELSVYMWCSYMVLTNPHMKPRIEFIIMKIFMKIVKYCPKSPRFMVFHEACICLSISTLFVLIASLQCAPRVSKLGTNWCQKWNVTKLYQYLKFSIYNVLFPRQVSVRQHVHVCMTNRTQNMKYHLAIQSNFATFHFWHCP